MNIYCDFLKKYQRKTVQKCLRSFDGKCLMALDMGLGKSIIALSCIQELNQKALIVCPASLKYNWVAEIEKFWPEKTPYVCNGQKPPKASLANVDIFICNYEILQYWKNYFINKRIQIFIADESHFLKEKSAKRTRAALAIADSSKYRILLSGTPIENKPIEIWSQIAMLNKNLFPSWLLFAKKYNGAIKNHYGWQMTRATNTKELNSILTEKCMIRLTKESVLKELPPIVRQVIPVEIDNRSEYRKAEEDIINWLRNNNTNNLDLDKTKKAEAQVKLDKLKLISARGKMKQVVDWVNQNSPNFKIVLFCYHREILNALHSKIDNCVFVPSEVKGIDRQNAVKRFQTDENCRVFLTTIRVGYAGFTLTASNTTVFIQQDWNASKHRQAEARVHRIGQKADSVNAIYFVSQKTVEEKIIRLIDTKDIDSTAIIDGKEVEENTLLTDILKQLKGQKNERKQRNN